jgi:UDP-glucose 4-epimerase
MKILITGGTGFIGLHTARAFLDAGHDVVATQFRVRRDPPFVANELGNRLQREIVDITSPYGMADVMRKHKIDGIVHLAVPGVGALSAAEDYRSNMLSLLNVLDAALTFNVKRVTIASSVVAYEGVEGPWFEHAFLPMTSTNATTTYKKAWEVLAHHFADRTKLDIVLARIGYIYGPLYHSMYNILARLVHSAVRGQELVKPNEGFGGDALDYCYVKDCADALLRLQTSQTLTQRTYNIGAGRGTTVAEVLAAVKKVNPAYDVALKPGQRDALHGTNAYMDLSAITRDTGYVPQFSIDAAIADYAQWLRDGNEH